MRQIMSSRAVSALQCREIFSFIAVLTDEKSRKTTVRAATPRRRADPTAVAAEAFKKNGNY